MKKFRIGIITGLAVLMLGICGCTSGNNEEYTQEKQDMAACINENSDLGLEFMQDLGEMNLEVNVPDGDASLTVFSDDGTVRGSAYYYPDNKSTVKIRTIYLSQTSNHNVLGISVGTAWEDAQKIMQDQGFKQTKYTKSSGREVYSYEKDGVLIRISVLKIDSKVEEIVLKMM